MHIQPPLRSIRVHLAGAIPDDASPAQASAIDAFVKHFAAAVFREGGSVIHGSHPSFLDPLQVAATAFVDGGGRRDALTLVRAQTYADTDAQLAEIEGCRAFASVDVIPGIMRKVDESLIPMREWMADRSDAVVAVAGRHWEVNTESAGVPAELEESLIRGKPGFIVAGFGGAMAGYVSQHEELYRRLRNGLSESDNRALSANQDIATLVSTIVEQLKRLPLVRENVPTGRLFRILALDGGGLRGTFTAAVLAKWDDMLNTGGGNGIVKHFDLVAGTSTGAILAIGLGLGLTPIEMLNFYKREGPIIFPKNRNLRHWLRSKHESSTLRSTLQAAFGAKLLRESCCRLVLPTVRAVHGEAEAIVTPHSADRTAFATISAVDAALASSAAPSYFDEAIVESAITPEMYLDGGIWANNPVLTALAESVRYLKAPLDRIDVLSVGTLGNEADFTESLSKGLAGWAPSSADLFFAAQEHGAAVLADSFLGPARHLRINQQTPSAIKLDDTEAVEDMTLRGTNVGKDSFVLVRSRFLDGFHAAAWTSTI